MGVHYITLPRETGDERMMTRKHTALATLAMACLLVSGGCSRARTYEGYVADPAIVATIQPGIDNKQSVEAAMGKPSFKGTMGDNDWYYVSRTLGQLAFRTPRPVQQDLLHVQFDDSGMVIAVNKTGMETVASISPNSDKTPTMGRNRSFFEDLFGNMGGAGTGTRTGGSSDPTRPD